MKKHLLLLVAVAFLGGQFLSGQIHHWPLTTDLNDAVGDKHGTIGLGDIIWEDDAVRGPVAQFDGNTWASLPSVINGIGDNMTLSVWYRMDEVQIFSRPWVFGVGDEAEPKDVFMFIPVTGWSEGDDTEVAAITVTNGLGTGNGWKDWKFPKSEVAPQVDTWYHLVVVIAQDTVRFFNDGVKLIDADLWIEGSIGALEDTENRLAKNFWPDPLFKGAMSDLRIYDEALSDAEVIALYNATKPQTGGTGEVPDPVHHWPMEADLNDAVGDKHGSIGLGDIIWEDDADRGAVAKFDGDTYASLPSFINGIGDQLTVAMWWRMDEVQIFSRPFAFGVGDEAEPKDVIFWIPVTGWTNDADEENCAALTVTNGLGTGNGWKDWKFLKSEMGPELDTWYFNVLVCSYDTVRFFNNDTKIIDADLWIEGSIGALEDTENRLAKNFWPDPYFKGALSDLMVWDKALTDAQVIQLYNETMGSVGIDDIRTNENVPKVYSYLDKISVILQEPYSDEVVSVYNITGALVAKSALPELHRKSFDTGIYIIHIEGSKLNYATKVFVNR